LTLKALFAKDYQHAQTDIPAKEKTAISRTRLFKAHEQQGWSESIKKPPYQGPGPA